VIFKSLPYSKFEEKGSTSISDVVNIDEPVVTGGTIQPETIDADYKYLVFPYILEYPILATDATNLKAWYKFDDVNNLGLNSSSLGTYFNATISGTPTISNTEYIVGSSSYFTGNGEIDGLILDNNSNKLYTNLYTKPISISFWCKIVSGGAGSLGRIFYGSPNGVALNSNAFQIVYNASLNKLIFTITTTTGGVANNELYTNTLPPLNTTWLHIVCITELTSTNYTAKTHTAKIYVNGVLNSSSTAFYYPLITQNYNFQIGRLSVVPTLSREYDGYLDDFRIYDKTLVEAEILELYNLNQMKYTVNFPEPASTECSALILGNPNYTYIPSLTLFGDYNISVGNTSSISKSDSTFTQNNSQTAQTLPFSNSITGSSVTYTSPRVIIKYKLTKVSSYTGKSQGILKYLPTPSTPQQSNTGSWTIEESANTTFKSDFLYILNKSSNPTLANNIYTTEFLFDPDTKFNDKANINKNYKYNICLSVISTHTTDKLKYCVAFVYYNNKNGSENFNKKIISSNNENDWTIDNYIQPTTQKRYVKITVKTINPIESLNVKI
jgi:hypothetical protein